MADQPTDGDRPHKYFEDQFDDEEVLFVFRKHPIVMRKGLIIGLLAWLIGPLYTLVRTYTTPDDLPSMTFFFGSIVVSILIGCLILVPWWISWYFSVFIVTDQRLIQITQKGLWNRSVVDMSLGQIQMVNLEQPIIRPGTSADGAWIYTGDVNEISSYIESALAGEIEGAAVPGL